MANAIGWSRPSALAATAMLGLLTACSGPTGPAPVVFKGFETGEPVPGSPVMATEMPPIGAAHRVRVRRGQTLKGLALALHVPARALIRANGLKSPYRLEAGQVLLVPATAAPQVAEAIPLDRPEGLERPERHGTLDRAGRAAPSGAAASRAAGAEEAATPPKTVESTPLTPPAPSGAPASAAAPLPVSAAAEPAPPAAAEAGAGSETVHGGRFPWPLRGHVLATYGSAGGSGHNDGINIAAPRGAPIAAIDSGVVAYAGNELRGYGNLILIKHADGWISAYAHCEELLVKRGERVTRGEIIARVGSSGAVREPQLHFELRRGNHPVDPRQFLAPLPSAANRPAAGEG
ncbi:MAG: M23 family metallopeptidase [Alphaproteobacteria bacterium]|nr:M23 family metallopeptidase [Alphaproteobacteria bacterium]MBV9861840.1 M23 family metallopeptidase [Alphaproteobacteria bacterium]